MLILLLTPVMIFCQPRTYDIISFQQPANWTKDSTASKLSFQTSNNKNGNWCKLTIYKSVPSQGSVENDFTKDWQELVEKTVTPEDVRVSQTEFADPWYIRSGTGSFTFNGRQAIVSLTIFSNRSVYVSLVAMTNSADHVKDIEDFVSHFNLAVPEQNTPPVSTASPSEADPAPGTYQFSSTNWDDGWTSSIYPDRVEVTRPGIRVLLHHQTPDNVEAGWQSLITPRYEVSEINLKDYGTPTSAGMTYYILGANARERATGKQVYVAVFRGDGGNTVIEVVADTYDAFSGIFANAVTETLPWDPSKTKTTTYWNKINTMYGRNRFAIGTQDLAGTWFCGDTVRLGNSSRYSSAATNLITINTYEYKFQAGGSYVLTQGSGTGSDTRSDNIKLIRQERKGNYTNGTWELRIDEEQYAAYFRAVPGGRTLVLTDANGAWRQFVRK